MTVVTGRPPAAAPAPPSAALEPAPSPASHVATPCRAGPWRVVTGVAVATVAVGAAVLLGSGLTGWPAFADDEGTYVAQAWAVLEHGDLAHYTYWYDHPPFGWIQLAGLTALAGPLLAALDLGAAVAEARALMLLPAVTSVLLTFVLARRSGITRPGSLLAAVLLAASPLSVSMLRQVLLDGLALPWVLGALVLASDPRRRLWSSGAAGLCLGVAVLTKETSLLLVPAVAVAVWQQADARTRAFCLTAFGTATTLVVLIYPLLAVLKGELLPGEGHVSLLEAAQFQLGGRQATGSALLPGTASHELVAQWLSTDPVLLGGGCLAAPFALTVRRLRPVAIALAVLVLTAARPGYLPQPFVLTLLPLGAVLLGAGADGAARRTPRLAMVGTAVAVVAVSVAWWPGLRQASSTDANTEVLAARDWVVDNVDPRARVLVDDTMFVDLAEAGFEPGLGVVWFYKLGLSTNLDPSVSEALPNGHRSFDYVVSTPVVRSAVASDPIGLSEVGAALDASTPVATFGDGDSRAEVRRLTGDGIGSGRIGTGA